MLFVRVSLYEANYWLNYFSKYQVWQVLFARMTHLLRSNDVYPAADIWPCLSTFHLCSTQTSSTLNTKLHDNPPCQAHGLKLFMEFYNSDQSSFYQQREVVWTIERLSLKYQGIMSQMTKLTRVTKAILRVPNRLFFLRINLPSQMGHQQAARANQTTQANRLSSRSILVKITCRFSALLGGYIYAEHTKYFVYRSNPFHSFPKAI